MIQACLVNDQGFANLALMLKAIANSQNMHFIDGSAQTQADLGLMSPPVLQTEPGGHVVNTGVDGDDGLGLTAGNLGLSKHQVALGFSAGSDLKQTHRFADIVVKELQSKWLVEVIPTHPGGSADGQLQLILQRAAGLDTGEDVWSCQARISQGLHAGYVAWRRSTHTNRKPQAPSAAHQESVVTSKLVSDTISASTTAAHAKG